MVLGVDTVNWKIAKITRVSLSSYISHVDYMNILPISSRTGSGIMR